MPKGTPTPHPHTLPPMWLHKIPRRLFPPCYRDLYAYLCKFHTCECWLYNYRLADRFGVSPRTIQLQLAWLSRHALVGISLRPDPTRPLQPKGHKTIRRIFIRHYPTAEAWLTALADHAIAVTARKHRLEPGQKTAWSDLTPAQFAARRQREIDALFALK